MNHHSILESTQRINVIGTSGSGKSFFSQQLSSLLGVSHIEIDAIFWGPNWYWPSDEEFFHKLKQELKLESWILDGNYTRTIPIKWEAVKIVIWIDYSFPRTLFQSVRRAIIRAWSKKELWPGTGNRESFKKSFFSKDSIILWSVKNYWKNKRKYESMMLKKEYGHIEFVRLRSPKESSIYINSLNQLLLAREAP